MSVRAAIAVLHSLFDLFQEMGGGVSLGPNMREIARRLRMVQAEAQARGAWSADLAFLASQLRARAAHYAMTYAPGAAPCPADTARLTEVVRVYSEMLMHLESQLGRDAEPVGPRSRPSRGG